MNNNFTCSRLQRFFYVVALLMVLAFAKADAQQSSSTKNTTYIKAPVFTVVNIRLKEYVTLAIKTTKEDQFTVETSQSGEYKNAVILSHQIRNDSLLITDPINPSFIFPQDKLSAHKIIDGNATLYIPENKILVINSQDADVDITGDYNSIYINQLSGSCKIDRITGNLQYVSVYGSVRMDVNNYKITSLSRSGEVDVFPEPDIIEFFAQLESISGDIRILKKRNK